MNSTPILEADGGKSADMTCARNRTFTKNK
nr:MAG TPA: hypothetical protein [Caudoviricetes sp.]